MDRFQKRGKLGCMSEPLIRRSNREQMLWRAVDVEQLIGEDHPARAIWELAGRLDLDGFYEGIECSEEEGGRPALSGRQRHSPSHPKTLMIANVTKPRTVGIFVV